MIRALLGVVLALLLALGWSLWRAEVHKGDAEAADVEAERATARADGLVRELADLRGTLDTERRRVAALNDAAAREQERIREIEADAKRRAADLVAGNVRLRHEIGALYTAQLSAGAATAGEFDATAQRGAELVGAALAVGAKCDARQDALIRAYEANR